MGDAIMLVRNIPYWAQAELVQGFDFPSPQPKAQGSDAIAITQNPYSYSTINANDCERILGEVQ